MTVSIAGVQVAIEDVVYAGITPYSPGLYQVNLRISDNIPDGDQVVVVSVDGRDSPPAGMIAIRRQ